MKILVTSHARAHSVKTIGALPRELLKDTYLVVYPEEEKEYKNVFTNLILANPAKRGLSFKRQWILENEEERFVVIIDDDIQRFCSRRTDDEGKFVGATDEQTLEMFKTLERWMKEDSVAHVSILPRQGANRYVGMEYVEVGKALHLLGYDLKVLRENNCRFDRLMFMSDYDMTLQLLKCGYKNRIGTKIITDAAKSNHPGGVSKYRTKEGLAEASNKLAELHFPFVSVETKETTTSWKGWGERVDVTIRWKSLWEAYSSI